MGTAVDASVAALVAWHEAHEPAFAALSSAKGWHPSSSSFACWGATTAGDALAYASRKAANVDTWIPRKSWRRSIARSPVTISVACPASARLRIQLSAVSCQIADPFLWVHHFTKIVDEEGDSGDLLWVAAELASQHSQELINDRPRDENPMLLVNRSPQRRVGAPTGEDERRHAALPWPKRAAGAPAASARTSCSPLRRSCSMVTLDVHHAWRYYSGLDDRLVQESRNRGSCWRRAGTPFGSDRESRPTQAEAARDRESTRTNLRVPSWQPARVVTRRPSGTVQHSHQPMSFASASVGPPRAPRTSRSSITTRSKEMARLNPITPGELLREDF